MSQLVNMDDLGSVMEKVVINGDLSPLSPAERTRYYTRMCESLGLNPLTKPFAYIKLNGKLTLYALRDCADQLRRNQGISIEIVSRTIEKGIMTVHVRAKSKDGRTDEDVGALPWSSGFKADEQANLIMKAITKAKRRVTLSICGLGMLDESEITGLPDAQIVGPDGEPMSEAGAAPKPKSAYRARKDGAGEKFKEIEKAIRSAQTTDDLDATRDMYAQDIADMPPEWAKMVAEKYEYRSEQLCIESHTA